MTNLLLAPGTVNVKVNLDPVYNNLASLHMIAVVKAFTGLDEWVAQAAASLPAEQMQTHQVLFDILYSAFEPDEDWPDFPAYLENLAEQAPLHLRNRFLKYMFPASYEKYVRQDRLMDLETFIAQIDRTEFDVEKEIIDDQLAQAHALLSDPATMHKTIVSHLTTMWHEVLAAEWEQHEAFLQEVTAALQSYPYSGQNAYDAIRSVTGRDAGGHWQRVLAPAETLIFIPSLHIGPYLLQYAYPPLVRIIFGARLPQGAGDAPTTLTRADLLVRLRTLADDTRLGILELLFEEGELCAQEIIARLGLSKSSASRHLSQLSATGYLTEHQREGKTKCYTLNPDRFRETMHFFEPYAQA